MALSAAHDMHKEQLCGVTVMWWSGTLCLNLYPLSLKKKTFTEAVKLKTSGRRMLRRVLNQSLSITLTK